jgi:hypothetical protein
MSSKYSTFNNVAQTGVDSVIFSGAYDPLATPNGTGNNTLKLQTFTASLSPGPSNLVGSTWVGRMGDATAPQLTLTIISDTQMSIKLDCVFGPNNILVGTAPVPLIIFLNSNTVFFRHIFQITNTSSADKNTFCSLFMNTVNVRFSSDTGTAVVSTTGGTILGAFTRQ